MSVQSLPNRWFTAHQPCLCLRNHRTAPGRCAGAFNLRPCVRRKHGTRDAVLHRPLAATLSSGGSADEDEEDLWRVHEELMKQLEERRNMQEELKKRVSSGALPVFGTSAPPPKPASNPNPKPALGPPSSPQLGSALRAQGSQASPQSPQPRAPPSSQQASSTSTQPGPKSPPGSQPESSARPQQSPSPSPNRGPSQSAGPPVVPVGPASSIQAPTKQPTKQPKAAPNLIKAPQGRPKPSEVDLPSKGKAEEAEEERKEETPPEPQPPPKVYNENAMSVVMVGAECAPWSKTGGLGDVMNALPKALARRGHRVMAIAPRYESYEAGWETGVRLRIKVYDQEHEIGYFHGYIDGVDYVFIDHPTFHGYANNIYGGSRQDIAFRCALLCKGALEAVWHIQCGGAPYGDNNVVFIANDWHTALLPVYLQAHYRDYDQMTYARSVFIIHNIAHQGRGPMAELGPLEIPSHYVESFRLYDPIGGEHMNIMKAGFQHAHRIVAVSHGYAWECQTQEGGWGLDGVLRDNAWKLRGIVNGMDYSEWSPERDPCLSEDGYQHYSVETLAEGKAACKAALQRELGLPVDPSVPMLGFIGRLDYQKGIDLIVESFDWLMDQGAQLILLGSGRDDLENALRNMESARHNQCRGWVGFSVKMAHRITAGCDILLMPSRFEPCGLNQLYAMAYGTVPVVHAVGGLRDTVQPFNPYDSSGTGWTYEWSSGEAFREAVWNAMYTFRDHKEAFLELRKRGMQQDLSWDNAAQQYEEVMLAAKYQW